MKNFRLPYFGEIDLDMLQRCYRSTVDFNGINVKLDINFDKTIVDQSKADEIKKFLENIGRFYDLHRAFIVDDFERDGETVDYVNFYFDELDEDELFSILGEASMQETEMLNKLELIKINLYPDHDAPFFAVFDYSIKIEGKYSNQLLVVKVNKDGSLNHITWES